MGFFSYFIKNNTTLTFGKANYIILLLGIITLGLGYFLMSSDQEKYGYGLLGLTVGPLTVLLGFAILFFAIFWTNNKGNLQEPTIKNPLWLHAIGLLVLCISFLVYLLTLEPTTSLWDCGEFIAAGYKLQVPHPPGTPLFLLLCRLFSLFAMDKDHIAYSMNILSAVASSFAVYLLFHTIILLGRKIIVASNSSPIILTIAATIGSLTFAFSDTFWFNATETEVYGMSCLFTALVFWSMLKWSEQTSERNEMKWLLLLAYLTGLSMGVHLLNLVAIPALGFIFYFKKYKVSKKGMLLTLIISALLILVAMEFLIIGIPSLASIVERLFVNGFHLPFGSGLIAFFILLIVSLFIALSLSLKKARGRLHLAVLALIFTLLGSSANLVIPIRSAYNTPIDENNPEDVMSLILYLKRDQYGSRPLLKGPTFTAGYPTEINKKSPRYSKDESLGRYVISDYSYEYVYDKKHTTLFPRMAFTEERHQQSYRNWLSLKEGQEPTMVHNLRFFFEFQIGHMFWRYFLWNFAGRESDEQNASWISPDQWFDQHIPDLTLHNKAHNNYYMIPLFIGIAGMFYHWKKSKRDALVLGLLFVFCGIAINVYLNQPPSEPRERDYIYVGAFYAFAVWIGFSVLWLEDILRAFLRSSNLRIILALCMTLGIPIWMIQQNWNDHDRSNRYMAEDLSKNMLVGCDKDAILFTGGDNDTFPLWYAQEVEEFRTDVRICILSLLNIDSYVQSMYKACNNSSPLLFTLNSKQYNRGVNDMIYLRENPVYQKGIDLRKYLHAIKSESPSLKFPSDDNELTIVPSKILVLDIDTNTLPAMLSGYPVTSRMEFQLSANLTKSDLAVLDIIVTNNWKRPIYFNQNTLFDFPYLKDYTIKEGMLYRLFPVKKEKNMVNSALTYQRLMHDYEWKGLNDPSVYTDPAFHVFVFWARADFYNLAVQLFNENKPEQARAIVLRCLELLPDDCVPYDYYTVSGLRLLLALKETKNVNTICKLLGDRCILQLNYYASKKKSSLRDYDVFILQEIIHVLNSNGNEALSSHYKEALESYTE